MSEISPIGCRISLISKAKIRYEGFLQSIDCETANEPIITLSQVWSFGTEDRPCERPTPPRNEVFESVVFRGRDLEDVRLVQSSVFLNQDSAIVSATPGSSAPASSSADKNSIDAPSNERSVISGSLTPSVPPMPLSEAVSFDMLSQNTARGSPSVSQPFFMNSRPGPIGTLPSDRSQPLDNRGPRPFGDGRSDVDTGMVSRSLGLVGKSKQPDSFYDTNATRTVVGSNDRFDSAQQQQWQNRTTYRDNNAQDFHSRNNTTQNDQYRRRRPGYNQWGGNQRGFRYPHPGPTRRGNRGGYFGHGGRPRTDLTSIISPTTFAGEYDYEKANAELAAELEKISISVPKSNSSVDGDAGKGEESGGSVAGDDAGYDKIKSFFDTLSSELMDKANGVSSQRMNRRDERLLNTATFGAVPNHYPRRGGMGGYYRRPHGGGGYGGYGYSQQRRGHSRQFGTNPNPKGLHNPAPSVLSTASEAP